MRNPTLDCLAAAIESVGTSSFYSSICDYLNQCMRFDNVVVVIFKGSDVPHVAFSREFGPNVFRFVEDQYLAGAYLLDPIYHAHMRRMEYGFYRLLDVAPDQFRSSRYFKWYYGRIGISDEISVFLPVETNTTITISMGKDGTTGTNFSQKAEVMLREHEEVIMALLKAHWSAIGAITSAPVRQTSVAARLKSEMNTHHAINLSVRQSEVAFLILQGHSSASIGLQLGVSTQTVKVFRKQLYGRCGINSQAELFKLMLPLLNRQNLQ